MPVVSSSIAGPRTDLDMARLLYERGEFADGAALAKLVSEESNDVEMKVRSLLLASSCESEQRRYAAALKTVELAAPLIDHVQPRYAAHFYGQRAHIQVKLNPDDADAGLIDYAAALDFAQRAGDDVAQARIRNNLAKRYSDVGRLDEGIIEVDKAIAIAERRKEWILLGRFYDQKAQMLTDHKHYNKALTYSEKAMRLLFDHPALAEARTTHGRALVALGAEFLEQEDPIDTFSGKRRASEYIAVSLDAELIQLALERAHGNLTHASDLLNIKHQSFIQSVERFRIKRKPLRRRGKSLLTQNKS